MALPRTAHLATGLQDRRCRTPSRKAVRLVGTTAVRVRRHERRRTPGSAPSARPRSPRPYPSSGTHPPPAAAMRCRFEAVRIEAQHMRHVTFCRPPRRGVEVVLEHRLRVMSSLHSMSQRRFHVEPRSLRATALARARRPRRSPRSSAQNPPIDRCSSLARRPVGDQDRRT